MMHSDPHAFVQGASCGARLMHARQAAGLTLEDVAGRLRMPLQVVRNLESDDWSTLGAPVFVRGQVRSYARLLGLDVEGMLEDASVAPVRPSTLVSHTHTPAYRRVAEQFTRRAIYIVLTAAIAVPVWFGARHNIGGDAPVQSLDLEPARVESATASTPPATNTVRPDRTPMVASMAAIPARSATGLNLTFNGESWLEVFDRDGRSIEQVLVSAGETRAYAAGQVGRVVIGDSSAVQVLNAGRSVDLAPFSRANVARFTLSSDGSPTPVAP